MRSQSKLNLILGLAILFSLAVAGSGRAQASGNSYGYDDSSRYGSGYYGNGYSYADPYYTGYGDDYAYYNDNSSRIKDRTFVEYPLPPIHVNQPRPLIPFYPDQYYEYARFQDKFLDPFYYKKFDANFYEKHQLEYLIKYNKIPFYPYY